MQTPRVTDLYAPRPLWHAALYLYHAGALTGHRRYRILFATPWYKKRCRPIGLPYQFHAWPRHSQNRIDAIDDVRSLAGPAVPPPAPLCDWCRGPGAPDEVLCGLCLAAMLTESTRSARYNLHHPDQPNPIHPVGLHRARYTRPAYHSDPMRRLRNSRGCPSALRRKGRARPRPRTRLRVSAYTLRYLHRQRTLTRQARALGMEPLCAGFWFDRQARIVYIQSAIDLRASENVVYAPQEVSYVY